MRRYLAGYALLGDFLIGEAEREASSCAAPRWRSLWRGQAALFDRLLAAVSEEYAREAQSRQDSTERHRAEHIDRLLAGEALDTSGLAYDFDARHTGLVANGPGAGEAMRELATALGRRLLLVRREEETAWVWLGARRPLDPAELERRLSRGSPLGSGSYSPSSSHGCRAV